MPKRLKRYYGQGHLHFLTFSCYRRLPLLGTARTRNLFVEELRRVRREYGFLLVGYVVMPNHGQSVVNLLRFVYRIGTKLMPDQPSSERFKSEMPAIPGVAGPGARRPGGNPAAKLVIGLLAVLLVVFLGARWALRPKHADPPA